MVQIINKDEFMRSKRKYMRLLRESVFIYPTDSIYGIGCDATNKKLVDKIRKIKKSAIQPFSVISPSKKWVEENCEISERNRNYFDQLGKKLEVAGEERAFTVILKLKNKDAVAPNVTPGVESIGVRMPDHWFTKIIEELGVPIVTTSANQTGEDFMESLENLNKKVKEQTDIIIYEGELKGHPSLIIHAESDLQHYLKDRR